MFRKEDTESFLLLSTAINRVHAIFAFCFHRKAFKLAFELLQGNARTGCQSIIVFATDGVDNDGDPVRCGPGYYTRSGYVPGQICKYDWNDVWDEVQARNRYMSPRVSWKYGIKSKLRGMIRKDEF